MKPTASEPFTASPSLAQRMLQRHRLVAAIRAYFDGQGFLEVDTPVAVPAPAPERYIDACPVLLHTPSGPAQRFLQTSPELAMKRLIAAGLAKIYQIAAVFRDNDFSPAHRPEFRLLEWYRAHSAWTVLLDDCEALLRHVAQVTHGSLQWPHQGRLVDLSAPFRRITVDAAFQRYAGFSIVDHLERNRLAQRLKADHVHHSATDSWDDLYHRIFLQKVEPPLLATPEPLFITHFPAPLAALAQLCPDDPRVAERFELYAGGLELANGFGELTCASVQRQRFIAERALRAAAGKLDYPLDEAFLRALENMPPTAGIALGLERLLMFMLDVPEIDAINTIAWSTA